MINKFVISFLLKNGKTTRLVSEGDISRGVDEYGVKHPDSSVTFVRKDEVISYHIGVYKPPVDHTITQSDLDGNPELSEKHGLNVGDVVKVEQK